ncbi:MAG: NUDIX domain-containing protein [Ktedonobacterales bacterium]
MAHATHPPAQTGPQPSARRDGAREASGRSAGEHPAVAVDVVILTVHERRLEVLLVKRPRPPFDGAWALPGAFVRQGESLEGAARRKLAEATGTRQVYLEQLYTFGDPERDPRMRVITVVYYALIPPDALSLTETVDARLWRVYDLPALAFDHNQIVEYTLQRLRGKLEYTTIGFQLLAPEFTLSELQEVYEAILNRPLDKRNFRKKLLLTRIVEPTHSTKMTGQHRPAQLYRFNPHAAA